MDLVIGMVIGFFILTYILPIGIQIFVCKNSKSKAGLILPAIILFTNLLYLLGALTFNRSAGDFDIGSILISFILRNIPTLILYLIYRHYRDKD